MAFDPTVKGGDDGLGIGRKFEFLDQPLAERDRSDPPGLEVPNGR